MSLPAGLLPLGGAKRRRAEEDDAGDEDDDGSGGQSLLTPADEAAALETDDAWASLHSGWAALGAWRDATLDKWGRRMLLAQVGGGPAVGEGQFGCLF